MNYRRCYNCKYYESDMYYDSKCKSPKVVEIEYNGHFKKITPYTKDIVPENGKDPCKYFSEGLFSKIWRFISTIRYNRYKKKYPERLL